MCGVAAALVNLLREVDSPPLVGHNLSPCDVVVERASSPSAPQMALTGSLAGVPVCVGCGDSAGVVVCDALQQSATLLLQRAPSPRRTSSPQRAPMPLLSSPSPAPMSMWALVPMLDPSPALAQRPL